MWLKFYIFIAVFLLPMDWFVPTGAVFREFGAKPATLVLTVGGLFGLLQGLNRRAAISSCEYFVLLGFVSLLALGYSSALLNFMLDWSGALSDRSPLTQLITQSLLIVACGIAVVGNAMLLRFFKVGDAIARSVVLAVGIHLTVFFVEASGLVDDSAGFLALFRADGGAIERPTGLFSEPSYFGSFAALYGTALFLIRGSFALRTLCAFLALLLYGCAIWVGAKTLIVVAGAQVGFFLLNQRMSVRNLIIALLMTGSVMAATLYFIQTFAALNVEENLSSAMRLGSALLGINVISEGYGLFGIGIGQFHFFYREEFAPSFLFLSKEALNQFSFDAQNRASTYNFFIRVLLEMGVIGFGLLIIYLVKLWRTKLPSSMAFVSMIFAGGLGFLMTQDSYFYPPLVFSSAMILAVIASRQLAETPSGLMPDKEIGHSLAV